MKKASGFTLVELSIVLVIISLITGGIVSGREMIHTARLNSVMNDYIKYETANNMFQAKYDALPGDFDEASDYWPSDSYNGNGDGLVYGGTERTLFFNQLALAGFIEGTYDRTKQLAVIGTSRPEMALKGVVPTVFSSEARYEFTNTVVAGWAYELLLYSTYEDYDAYIMTPADAKMIDKKMDDSMPGTGKVVGYGKPGQACADSHALGDMLTAVYDVGSSSKACSPLYHMD